MTGGRANVPRGSNDPEFCVPNAMGLNFGSGYKFGAGKSDLRPRILIWDRMDFLGISNKNYMCSLFNLRDIVCHSVFIWYL